MRKKRVWSLRDMLLEAYLDGFIGWEEFKARVCDLAEHREVMLWSTER